MTTTYDYQPDTALHPLDCAILEVELAQDCRTKAIAALAVQHIWNTYVTADDFKGNHQVIYRGQE